MSILSSLFKRLFKGVIKDYSDDYEREIRGQYSDGNYLFDQDGNQLSLEDALGTIPKDESNYGIFGNLGSGLNKLVGLVSGFFGNLTRLPDSELFNQGFSWLNQFTGANLTGAQQQMNDYNAEQAAIQRGWQERMSNTSYQRAVADLSNAGLNPAMVMGGSPGATTPSGSASSGTAVGAHASAILDLIMNKANLSMQDAMSKRQSETAIKTAQIAADATVKTARIKEGVDREANQIRLQELDQRIEEARSRTKLEEEQAKTEEQKRKAMEKSMLLDEANAQRIKELLPYEKALATAQTAEARWHAELDMIEAGLKNSLVSNGLVHYLMEQYRVQGDIDETRKDILEMSRKRYKDGDTPIHHVIHGLSSLISDVTSSYLIDPTSLLKIPLQ